VAPGVSCSSVLTRRGSALTRARLRRRGGGVARWHPRSRASWRIRGSVRIQRQWRTPPFVASTCATSPGTAPDDVARAIGAARDVRIMGPLPRLVIHAPAVPAPRLRPEVVAAACRPRRTMNVTVDQATAGGSHDGAVSPARPPDKVEEVATFRDNTCAHRKTACGRSTRWITAASASTTTPIRGSSPTFRPAVPSVSTSAPNSRSARRSTGSSTAERRCRRLPRPTRPQPQPGHPCRDRFARVAVPRSPGCWARRTTDGRMLACRVAG